MPAQGDGEQGRGLVLVVTEQADETVSDEKQIAVAGKTSHGAVVSVGDRVVEVDAVGSFRTMVILDEGANAIDVVTSDSAGNERYAILEVIYAP